MAQQYLIQAQHLATRLSLKALASQINEVPASESSNELIYELGPKSKVYIYNFGAIVFFNVSEDRRYLFLKSILGERESLGSVTTEDFVVEEVGELPNAVSHETAFNKVRVSDLTPGKINLICGVVAESTALEYFELIVERDLLHQTQKIARNLRDTGNPDLSMIEMSKYVGLCLATKQEIISEMYIVDAPEETWDSQTLSKLYVDVKILFELETRFKVLEYKLKLVQETVDVIVEMLRFKKQNMLEMIIIVLIAIEVGWFLIKIFFPGLPTP